MHLLKNGHAAHELTTEDRRKAAAMTNAIRREKKEPLEQLRLNAWIEKEVARRQLRILSARGHEPPSPDLLCGLDPLPDPGSPLSYPASEPP
jgi:hypothetical protein